jgi:hypothetical protein
MMNPRLWAGLAGTLLCTFGGLHAQSLSPSVDPVCGVPRLALSAADAQAGFQLRAGDDLENPAAWETLLRLSPGTHQRTWYDPDVSKLGRRFYRLERRPPAPVLPADTFGLNDHTGRRHDLAREGDARAVVLLFTDNAHLGATWTALKPLQQRFGANGVKFWMVNPKDTRESLAAAATAAAVDAPVLHDVAQLVARAYQASTVQEVVALDPLTMTPFYQGALATECDVPGSAVHEDHLSAALEQFLAGQTVAVEHVRPLGASLGLAPIPTPNYAQDIAPLLQLRCVSCHRPGDIGSYAMTSHAIIAERASSIRFNLLAGHMPPWHADPAHGHFANDYSLTPAETARLVAWVDAGAPRGTEEDPLVTQPPPPPVAWPLGQPDKIAAIQQQTLPASGEIPYRYLIVQNPFTTDVWLRAAAVRPGNRAVVHHCLVFVATSLADILQVQGGLGGFFAGYVPGMDQVEFPEGTGKFLPKGAYLIFQMHYTPSGEPATDRTELGFYLAPTQPPRKLVTTAAYTTEFSIPPGAKDHQVVAEATIAQTSILFEMSPHMHYRGARMRFEALYPDGSSETLLNVPGYEFAWQTLYRLAEPKRLPAGTKVRITGGFDNSRWNPWNPNPESTVLFGEQTDDEMLIGYLNLAVE